MLILTRRLGETILIGDDIEATLVDIRGNQVRIGIQAPKEVEPPRVSRRLFGLSQAAIVA